MVWPALMCCTEPMIPALISYLLTKTDGVAGSLQTLTNRTAFGTLFIYAHLLYSPQDKIHWLET